MKLLKTLFIAFLGMMMLQTPAFADDDERIQIHELPIRAQTILRHNFGHLSIDKAKMEKDDGKTKYEVKFTNGSSIEFNGRGEWKKIKCKKMGVPARLVPMPILNHVRYKWPHKDVRIMKIERKHQKYEVELSNDKELKFNQNFKIIDIDD